MRCLFDSKTRESLHLQSTCHLGRCVRQCTARDTGGEGEWEQMIHEITSVNKDNKEFDRREIFRRFIDAYSQVLFVEFAVSKEGNETI